MRVIHITEAFGGGLRTAITNYITATPHIDHTLFVRGREGHETTAVPPHARLVSYTGGLAGFYSGARRLVANEDFDIVHLHASFAGVMRAFLPRSSRIVYSPHCYAMEAEDSPLHSLTYWAIEGMLAQRRQLMIGVSPREIEIGRRLNKRMQAHLVPNTVLPADNPAAPRDTAATDRPVIAMLGRIDAQKGPRYFAQVAALGRDRYHYLWIGGGVDGRDELAAAGVEITGWVSPEQARDQLTRASLYVHTAGWEGGPLATLEAADAGCPVICRDIPSMRSLGYHLAGKSPQETAATVEKYFTDTEYRAQVQRESSQLLTTYSFERMSNELVTAYSLALSE